MKTPQEIIGLTRAERLAEVRTWATALLATAPASELNAKIEVHRIGAEFPEMMTVRDALESMRDFPHFVYELSELNGAGRNMAAAPTVVAGWLHSPGLLCVQ